jgi:hypothetical protein
MRRFVAMLLVLTLCTSVMPTATARGGSRPRINVDWRRAAAVLLAAKSIHEALAAAKKDVRAFHARLRAQSCGSGKCYAAADVEAAVTETRTRVRAAIPADALPLQAAVAAEIERLTTLGAPSPPAVIQLVRMPPESPEATYDANQTDSMFQRVLHYLDEIGSYKSYKPEVEFRSNPSGAWYEIQIADTTITSQTGNTNQKVPEVWRGVYTGFARKAGYKDARISINLMNNKPRVTCTCRLAKASAPVEESSTCLLKW